MRKMRAFIMLTIICISLVNVAIAADNNSTNTTGNATVTPVVTQTTTQSPQTTEQPAQTTVQQTVAQPVQTPAKFRIGPTVRIRPLNDEINKNQDGMVELYFDNPSINDVSLTVDARISVPSGIHVYGQGFGQAAAAGMVYGVFDVPPGTARTINIVIKAEKVGDFSAQFTGTYYPDGNKDAYQPISLTHPFKVSAVSAEPLKDDSATAGQTEKSETTAKSPGMTILLAIIAIALLAYTMRRH